MRKLEVIVTVLLSCLAVVGVLVGVFLFFLFLSESLVKILELTGAPMVPEVGRVFKDLFSFWVGLGTVMLLSFCIAHRFGPTIEAYGETFELCFLAIFTLLILSWLVILLDGSVINLEDAINSFVKNLPSPDPYLEELPKHYGKIFRSWPFWSGVGGLLFLLVWSFVLPSSFASFFGAEKLQKVN